MKKVKLTINGIKVAVPKGSTLLDAARIARIDIPTLCYHEGLSVGGGCRLCLVEVEGEEKLVTACTYLAREGIKVVTESKRIYEARKKILELLFSDHPKSCMTCESSGDCKLEQYAYEYQIDPNHFRGEEHSYPIETINPFIERDYNKCIKCGLCVIICDEMQGRSALAFVGRGFDIKISTPYEKKLEEVNCKFCGQCVAVCPSGALIEKQRKGKGREWELKKITTICPYCGCGCTIDLNVKDNQIVKVTSKEGFGVNGIALCAKGRFGLDWVNREERLKFPLIKRRGKFEEVSWEEALDL
jgi:formate dehydrogenase alpha subunit